MSPEEGGPQTPHRGASSCWLQADPRSNLITLDSLVKAHFVAAAGVQKVCRVSFPADASLKKGAPGPQARAGDAAGALRAQRCGGHCGPRGAGKRSRHGRTDKGS